MRCCGGASSGIGALLIGGLILGAIVLMALTAPLVAPHDPYDQQLARKLIPPIWHASAKATWAHPLGTDHLGRDYLSRLLYGAQISLLIGFSAMLISGVIGTVLGVLAGYFGGRMDMVVNFIVTTRLSMPVVLVALAVVSIVGVFADRRHMGAGAADLGSLRRGHAQRHAAGEVAGVRHRRAGARMLHAAHPVHGGGRPTSSIT